MNSATILWTRSHETTAAAQAWLRLHAPEYSLFTAPLQTYLLKDSKKVAAELPRCHEKLHIIITSPNGVEAAARAIAHSLNLQEWQEKPHWWAVGPGTKGLLRKKGIRKITVATPPNVEGLVRQLEGYAKTTASTLDLLSIAAANARPNLRQAASKNTWQLQEIIGYTTQACQLNLTKDQWQGIAAIPLSSAATVTRLIEQTPAQQLQRIQEGQIKIIAIGENTATAVRAAGFPLAAMAEAPTMPDLLAATVAALETSGPDRLKRK